MVPINVRVRICGMSENMLLPLTLTANPVSVPEFISRTHSSSGRFNFNAWFAFQFSFTFCVDFFSRPLLLPVFWAVAIALNRWATGREVDGQHNLVVTLCYYDMRVCPLSVALNIIISTRAKPSDLYLQLTSNSVRPPALVSLMPTYNGILLFDIP